MISHGSLPPSIPDGVSLITSATARRATPDERATGILAWVTFEVLGLFRIDGATLRATKSDRRLTLSFPMPTTRSGKRVQPVRPIDDVARRAIERAVIEALWRGGEAPR